MVDATVYQDKNRNVYEVFLLQHLQKESDLFNHQWGGRWKRFLINLEQAKVQMIDLLVPSFGNYELPTFNDKYHGVKENCFTYLVSMF